MITATWRTRVLAVGLAGVTLLALPVSLLLVISTAYSRNPAYSSFEDLAGLDPGSIALFAAIWPVGVAVLILTLIVMIWWRRAWLVPAVGLGVIIVLLIASVATSEAAGR